jgi:Mg2+/citrate symporter
MQKVRNLNPWAVPVCRATNNLQLDKHKEKLWERK